MSTTEKIDTDFGRSSLTVSLEPAKQVASRSRMRLVEITKRRRSGFNKSYTEDNYRPSVSTEPLFAGEISKVESQAAQAIAEQKANSEAQIQQVIAELKAEHDRQLSKIRAEYELTITKLKAEVGAKEKCHSEEIAKIRSENEKKTGELVEQVDGLRVQAVEMQKTHTEEIAGVRTEKEAAIAKIKAEYEQQILKEKAKNAHPVLCAKDIMQKNLVWASPEDSVRQTLIKMRQLRTSYVLVGWDGIAEGIVSKTDLTGAVSPYLRPEFSKWRRPLDDATLQIKIKWIMSKSTHSLSPEVQLSDIIRAMFQFGRHALPVINEQGKVLGLVTADDIFKAILRLTDSQKLSAGETI